MAEDNFDKLIFENTVEEAVRHAVKKTIKELGACSCETCYLDACAIALNSLEPKYVTTKKGALISGIMTTKLSNQTAVVVEATKAVKQVMANPHH